MTFQCLFFLCNQRPLWHFLRKMASFITVEGLLGDEYFGPLLWSASSGVAKVTHKGATSSLSKRAGSSEERSPRQESDTELRDLTAITGHGPSPPEGGTSRRRSGGNSTPYNYCRSENPLTYPAAPHLSTRDAPRGGGVERVSGTGA
ncbi:hypothetical protein AVEN_266361-1 [Araneus ventricosus]|uniref:Uncharacterized protein n=1 Tax=Araneus ventricosus TaxID=182803 RepID=A0A4Y2CRW3_ARAVE|nr:hypothetical protein AVEN_266361-1 [Araneus ventricosus]